MAPDKETFYDQDKCIVSAEFFFSLL